MDSYYKQKALRAKELYDKGLPLLKFMPQLEMKINLLCLKKQLKMVLNIKFLVAGLMMVLILTLRPFRISAAALKSAVLPPVQEPM